MIRGSADALQHPGRLLDQRPDGRCQAGSAATQRELAAEAQGEAGGEGDHDGRVVGHAGELLFSLDGGAHDVEGRGQAGGVKEVADLGGRGRVVDDAAVDGEAGVGDEDLDVGWEAMFLYRLGVRVRMKMGVYLYVHRYGLTRPGADGYGPFGVPLLEERVD